MEHLTAFLTRMPKVELHVHLESTMPGEMLARFAARQGRELLLCGHAGGAGGGGGARCAGEWTGAYPVQRDDPEPHPLAPVLGTGDHRRGDRWV